MGGKQSTGGNQRARNLPSGSNSDSPRKPRCTLKLKMGPRLQSSVHPRVGPVGVFHSYSRLMASFLFLGGPADGHVLAVPGDPGDPPLIYRDLVSERSRRNLVYRRETSPHLHGPLWVYRYTGEEDPQ